MNILSALYAGKIKFLRTKKSIEERAEEADEFIQFEKLKKTEEDSGLQSSNSNTEAYETPKPSRR
jgi:hypothetical protein